MELPCCIVHQQVLSRLQARLRWTLEQAHVSVLATECRRGRILVEDIKLHPTDILRVGWTTVSTTFESGLLTLTSRPVTWLSTVYPWPRGMATNSAEFTRVSHPKSAQAEHTEAYAGRHQEQCKAHPT